MDKPYNQDYQHYDCVYWPKTCEWRGLTNQMLDHFEEKHPHYIRLVNPFDTEYKSLRPCTHNMLIVAFNMVFLINIKVCCETRNIYYCVRLLTDGNVNDYEYELYVDNTINDFTIEGVVVPPGSLAIETNESIAVSFDSLLDHQGKLPSNLFMLILKMSI